MVPMAAATVAVAVDTAAVAVATAAMATLLVVIVPPQPAVAVPGVTGPTTVTARAIRLAMTATRAETMAGVPAATPVVTMAAVMMTDGARLLLVSRRPGPRIRRIEARQWRILSNSGQDRRDPWWRRRWRWVG